MVGVLALVKSLGVFVTEGRPGDGEQDNEQTGDVDCGEEEQEHFHAFASF